MNIDYIFECRKFYDKNFKQRFGHPIGCSQREIELFQAKNDVDLPASYKQFLLWMGGDLNGIFKGSEWFLCNVEENNMYLDELLRENEIGIDHQEEVFCFFSHQGYMSAWFSLTSNKEDPECYFFSEANKESSIICYNHFSAFLLAEMQGALR